MSQEIERKYLVDLDAFLATGGAVGGKRYQQGYLTRGGGMDEMRVRLVDGQQAFVTVKSKGDLTRAEHEFAVDMDCAGRLLGACIGTVLEKTRYRVPAGGDLVFEVDIYEGGLKGLAVAEIEIPSEETSFEKPAWLGEEITFDKRYKNAALAIHGLPATGARRKSPGL